MHLRLRHIFLVNRRDLFKSYQHKPNPSLRSDGMWGYQDPQNWADYLSWLDGAGLLTTALQSRNPDNGHGLVSLDDLRKGPPEDNIRMVSLDDLRSNDPAVVGEKIPLEDIPQVFTNDFLDADPRN